MERGGVIFMKHLKVEASYKSLGTCALYGWTSFAAVDNRPQWIAEVRVVRGRGGGGYNEGVASLLCVYYYT
jgi:hypothetical protein